jgi:2-C-methyl-D-erythritol 4-phosphate cytidylyltransferase
MAIVALIPAAGVGQRAGATQPKQYEVIAGAPLLVHTLRAFAQCARIVETVVIVSPDDSFIDTLPLKIGDQPVLIARCGGRSRAETVNNGLQALRRRYPADTWVLVHDAARCCISPHLIDRLIDACITHPVGGLLALPAPDTLKRANDRNESVETIDRAGVWHAQTPQMFRLRTLLSALETVSLAHMTDEASAVEHTGARPLLVPGTSTNLKVTYPEDFAMAEALIRSRI